ncbi:hypothetical protein [Nonomuraea sp. NPDC049129]
MTELNSRLNPGPGAMTELNSRPNPGPVVMTERIKGEGEGS